LTAARKYLDHSRTTNEYSDYSTLPSSRRDRQAGTRLKRDTRDLPPTLRSARLRSVPDPLCVHWLNLHSVCQYRGSPVDLRSASTGGMLQLQHLPLKLRFGAVRMLAQANVGAGLIFHHVINTGWLTMNCRCANPAPMGDMLVPRNTRSRRHHSAWANRPAYSGPQAPAAHTPA
jgi:hypothetical protein